MNEDIKNTEPVTLTDEQVHKVYTELADTDKASVENLAAAEKETEETTYTAEDNTEVEVSEIIPGVNAIPASAIADDIKEDENDIKDALDGYDLDDDSMMQMLTLINEFKAGDTKKLYSRLPKAFKKLVDGMVAIEDTSNGKLSTLRNAAAKVLVESFINDAKITAAVDDFSAELNTAVNEMNSEYDALISNAIEDTFNKIEEIRATDPAQADRIESIKNAFDDALTFEKQLECSKKISKPTFKKLVEKEYNTYVRQFNTKVNNNSFGVKIPDIQEILPIIKTALCNKYSSNAIKKFIICICKTIANPSTLDGTAYNYRMISSIYRYKFTTIDEKGEYIFANISKVIDEIIS